MGTTANKGRWCITAITLEDLMLLRRGFLAACRGSRRWDRGMGIETLTLVAAGRGFHQSLANLAQAGHSRREGCSTTARTLCGWHIPWAQQHICMPARR
jgi:hypothetical protein